MPSTVSPPISLVVPVHDLRPYVARCLESIVAQTYRRLEIIVVDDASRDGSADLLDEWAAGDDRIQVLHQSTNVGVHAARAAGVRVARGEYIGFVDGDDWIAPEMYAELVGTATGQSADIVLCGANCATGVGQLREPKVRFERGEVFTDDLPGRFARLELGSGVLWNKLYRTEVIRASALRPLERAVDAAEDYIVNFGAFLAARRIVTLSSAPYFYFTDPATASRRASRAASFSRTLRAYVVCLEAYAAGGERIVALIDQLYVRQLRFSSYAVDSAVELGGQAGHMQESLQRLARIHPAGIYSLIHAFDLPRPRDAGAAVRPAARQVWASVRGLGRAVRSRVGGSR